MHGTLHTLLSEPRAPGASDPLRGDWLLVAVVSFLNQLGQLPHDVSPTTTTIDCTPMQWISSRL